MPACDWRSFRSSEVEQQSIMQSRVHEYSNKIAEAQWYGCNVRELLVLIDGIFQLVKNCIGGRENLVSQLDHERHYTLKLFNQLDYLDSKVNKIQSMGQKKSNDYKKYLVGGSWYKYERFSKTSLQ